MLIVLQSASKLLDTGLNTVQSTLLLKKQVEVEKVQEDLDIKRRQFAERMTACKRKEEELKKKQTQVCMYNFQRKFCRLVISQFLHCWFSLSRMSFKTEQNKSQKKFNRQSPESGKWNEVNMQRPLPRFRGIIWYIRDIRRNVSPKFIEIYMEMLWWCPSGWAPTLRMEANRKIEFYRVLLQKREFIPRGTHKH